MCDGGHGTETMFSFLGGVTGKYEVGSKYFDKPDEYFSIIDKARSGRMHSEGSIKHGRWQGWRLKASATSVAKIIFQA